MVSADQLQPSDPGAGIGLPRLWTCQFWALGKLESSLFH